MYLSQKICINYWKSSLLTNPYYYDILNYRIFPKLRRLGMSKGTRCCQVDAIVSIDARGQIVLPKEVREKAEINPGDKFLLISSESEGKLCCLLLVKAAEFAGTVKEMLGPMAKELLS